MECGDTWAKNYVTEKKAGLVERILKQRWMYSEPKSKIYAKIETADKLENTEEDVKNLDYFVQSSMRIRTISLVTREVG